MTRNRVLVSAALLVLVESVVSAAAQLPSGETATHAQGPTGGSVLLLSKDLEMRLAVNALPKVLRDGAAVLVLESTGYVKARSGTNAFTCMVSRRGGNFYPVCFDEEGTRTILPAFADDTVLRLRGASDQDVERHFADGFEQGAYRSPARPGVAYMLS